MSRLYIAAKAPRPGLVKTRLARHLGETAATSLYLAFLTDLADRFSNAPFPTGWYITPDDAREEVARPLSLDASVEFIGQGGGNWGVRQDRLFATLLGKGAEEPIVLIGSDWPQLTVDFVERAFAVLETNDLVFGPVLDGGYGLVGMKRYQALLGEVSMSHPGVLDQLLEIARRQSLRVGLLEPTFDIDEVSELPLLASLSKHREDLAATRRAIAALPAGVWSSAERETA